MLTKLPVHTVLNPVWRGLFHFGWEDPGWGRYGSMVRMAQYSRHPIVVERSGKFRSAGEIVSAVWSVPPERGWQLLAQLESEH